MTTQNALTPTPINSELLPVKLPAIQGAVSANAGRYKDWTMWLLLGILVLTAIYALASPGAQAPWTFQLGRYTVNLVSAIAGVAFGIAFILHLVRLVYRPERKWLSSRGLSEEIKSFAWRFAVGGLPLSKEQFSQPDAEESLSQTLHAFLRRARTEQLEIPLPKNGGSLPFITSWMSNVRAASLSDRQAIYGEKRILGQQTFYLKRASTFRRRSALWSVSLLIVEGGLALAAAAHAIGLIPLNFFGVGATLVAAGTSWVQFNQYRAVADLYSDMAFELGEFYRRCTQPAHPWTESTWGAFVDRVEGFLEVEHGAWRKLIDPDGRPDATDGFN